MPVNKYIQIEMIIFMAFPVCRQVDMCTLNKN